MKKIILLIFIAAAIALSSCDDGKRHCWQVTVEYKAEGLSQKLKMIYYRWRTADEIDIAIANIKAIYESVGAKEVKVTKKKLKLSEEDCIAMNPSE